MRMNDLARTINLASMGLDVDRLAVAFRAADSISESLRALDPWLNQSLSVLDTSQATVASALKLSDDMQRASRLLGDSPLMQDFRRTSELMVGWELRFRLPEIAEIGSLLANVQRSPWPETIAATMPQTSLLADALAEMTKPWLNIQAAMRSVAGLTELHDIGRVLSGMPGFGDAVAGALRMDLGDWRDPISWRSDVLADLDLRASFYTDLGFNRDLTAFPPEAFDEGIGNSGVRGERPPLIALYKRPVPAAADDTEEAAYARTNMAHDWLLRLETQLRAFIDEQMTRAVGEGWAKRRLPNGMYEEWKEKHRKAREAGASERPLIAYADFTDYMRVICRRDNWRDVFAVFFGREESVRESFQRLYPIRLDTMHARVITQDDELLLYVETRRLMKAVARD